LIQKQLEEAQVHHPYIIYRNNPDFDKEDKFLPLNIVDHWNDFISNYYIITEEDVEKVRIYQKDNNFEFPKPSRINSVGPYDVVA
jgi:hypothetical protein